MNTFEILEVLKGNSVTSEKFYGVFPCNHLPEKIVKPALIIGNTDPSWKRGRHWAAFHFPKKGPAEYFDSFGGHPTNKYFIRFLKRNSVSYNVNTKRLQGDFSSTCGFYCFIFVYWCCFGV